MDTTVARTGDEAGVQTSLEPPAGCTAAADASTVDSFLNAAPVRWAVRDGRLLVFGGGAQAFSLVYEPKSS